MLADRPAQTGETQPDSREAPTMTYEERVQTRDVNEVADGRLVGDDVVVNRSVAVSPSGGELVRRIVVLVFGIIQILIVLRIVLLLLDAREANDIVRAILNASQIFVAPFDGIFRTNALTAGGSILDIAAIAALVGWSVLEMIVLWIADVFRREPRTA
jgi:hypothetical protein